MFQNYSLFDWICCMKKLNSNDFELKALEDYPCEFNERYELVNETQRELEYIKEKMNK